jgi:hypothetical protein
MLTREGAVEFVAMEEEYLAATVLKPASDNPVASLDVLAHLGNSVRVIAPNSPLYVGADPVGIDE